MSIEELFDVLIEEQSHDLRLYHEHTALLPLHLQGHFSSFPMAVVPPVSAAICRPLSGWSDRFQAYLLSRLQALFMLPKLNSQNIKQQRVVAILEGVLLLLDRLARQSSYLQRILNRCHAKP